MKIKTFDRTFWTLFSFCFMAYFAFSFFSVEAKDRPVDNSEFVIVMLNHDNWPNDMREQQELAKKLQQKALDGPLSEGFELVHQFETIPALSGWLISTAVKNNIRLGDVPRKQQLVTQSKLIKSIDTDIGGRNIPTIEKNSGSGSLSISIPQVGADRIHKLGIKGQGIEIGVLDTGIDTNHPDLFDSVGAQQCFCFNPDRNCCPNRNSQQSGLGSAEDDNNHGSHVSGIIGSNGTLASVGVAPSATITMVKVLDANNRFYSSSDIVLALDWLNVNRPGLDVVSMSLGTFASFQGVCDSTFSFTEAMFIAVQNLVSKGVVVVASSGNDSLVGRLSAPACLSNVIAVGAVDRNDNPAFFSNIDTTLDLFAPGVNIISSTTGGQTSSFSGTSMACPHVSGLVGLIKQASPSATRPQIINAMKQNGISITVPNNITRSRIDAYSTLCSIYDCSSDASFIPSILDLLFIE